jgi:hypothetical protein
MNDKGNLKLLPKEQWTECDKCHGRIPQFAMTEDLRAELDVLVKKSPIQAMARIRQAGCSYEAAQAWTVHQYHYCREGCTTPCPFCGKTLRTAEAKQCRFCGADWH